MDGDTAMVAGDPGQGEQPLSSDVLSALVEGFRARRASIRAAALAADVRLPDGDAVRVELEHAEGQAIAVLLPYKKKRLGRGLEFQSLRAGTGSRQIWADT